MNELPAQSSQPANAGRVRRRLIGLASGAGVFVLVTGLGGHMFKPDSSPTAPSVAPEVARVEMLTQGTQTEILDQGDEATARNKLIPMSGLSGGLVAPFRAITPDSKAYAIAHKCLTQAVYYEAGNQSSDGQRAVAQVILNRVRHPAYPDSVCGVVYEGWNQPTCQFTFVCDGSLLRSPDPSEWRKAQEIATEALAGKTEAAVGTATNYHADYVLPRWAYTLPKITQLGAHIFYRLPGSLGAVQALSARWDGHETIPDIDLQALRQRIASTPQNSANAPVQFVPGTTVTPLVSDRHAPDDVGGRIDTTKPWRLTIPLPISAHSAVSTGEETAIESGGDRT